MPWATDVIYRYDGSFDGLLCCVFESFVKKETPLDIVSEEDTQWSLYLEKWIESEPANAERVYSSLDRRIHPEAGQYVKECFLTCLPERAILIYRWICLGYRIGGAIVNELTNDTVFALNKAVLHLRNEAHLLTGFVRFSDYDGTLVSVIKPKNAVLPVISDHFCGRYPEEKFLIFDKTHHMALVYRPYEAELLEVEDFTPPEPDAREEEFRRLWRNFHETIGIEGRFSAKRQRGHLPLRYRAYMTEFVSNVDVRTPPSELNGDTLRLDGG